MRIALVNTNRVKPAIAPIGLEYVAESISRAGFSVEVLDLCWADDWEKEIRSFFQHDEFQVIGVTLRNTDDCAYPGETFIPGFVKIINCLRKHSHGTLVIGGVGFSIMPREVLELCQADFGIWGDGEFTFLEFLTRMEKKSEYRYVPGLIHKFAGKWKMNPPRHDGSVLKLPAMTRRWVNNRRYFSEGGQIGFESKRGCAGRCIYCADPLAKGKKVKVRPPKDVADELEKLLQQGINCFHTCDSEFNLPPDHAHAVCEEIIRRNDDSFYWYAYCAPYPFPRDLAKKMKQAGCVGINFGVDSGDPGMLKRLKRNFTPGDIIEVARTCRDEGITVMFDLLSGAPGETRASIIQTIELMKEAEPDRVGVSVGLRVYPGTGLADQLEKESSKQVKINPVDLLNPVFFLEPGVAPFIFELLDRTIDNDPRFFFFDPGRPAQNYNYNANQRLVEAILKGYRGAYWDILRKYSIIPGISKDLKCTPNGIAVNKKA
jgi:radical SAM superfamily enzyme YgiQ (UPF0313 family)